MALKSKSVKETQKIAAKLAQKIVRGSSANHARVVALEGELGAGKTTFVKGFAHALGIKEKIYSPTFVLLRAYKLVSLQAYKLLVHIDAYRLRDHRDLIPLSIKEIFADPQNIVLIEWAERIRKILPRKHTKVHIDHINQNSRKILIKFQN